MITPSLAGPNLTSYGSHDFFTVKDTFLCDFKKTRCTSSRYADVCWYLCYSSVEFP